MNRILVNLLLLISLHVYAQSGNTYYVAVDGDDNNPGTFAQPFASWQAGIDATEAGDTLYIRGGVYYSYAPVRIDTTAWPTPKGHCGTANKHILIAGYPADIAEDNWPILDCKYHCDSIVNPYGDIYNSGICLNKVEYISLRCLEVRNVFQCDSVVSGAISASECANITYERLKVHDVGERGFYHFSGAWSYADSAYSVDVMGQAPSAATPIFNQPDTTRWINCDVWNICDTLVNNPGNAGDAWKVISYNGNYYLWEGCRAWNYSDDGFDPNNGKRVFKNCWAMSSNKYAVFGIEGNGFKTSSLRTSILPYYTSDDHDKLVNDSMVQTIGCLALFCPGSGFKHGVESDTTDNPLWYNNTTYKCGIGISSNSFGLDSIGDIFHNNLVYASTKLTSTNTPYEVAIMNTSNYNLQYALSHNSWVNRQGYPCFTYNPLYNVTDDDFVITDSLELVTLFTAPRNPDGSLPDTKPLMLNASSDLIDEGCNAGQPFCGNAPDVGYHEYELTSCFEIQDPVYINSPVNVNYTGNASASATYYWDFGCATVISGSGQGPYTLEWPSVGCDTVSLYIEEANATSDTTANEIYIQNDSISSTFVMYLHIDTLRSGSLTDTLCPGIAVEIIYTGNASDSATYYWDFGSANVIYGSGQGPYLVNWTNSGWNAVSLYVEESGIHSDTTTNETYILTEPIFNIIPYPNDTVSVNDTITLTGDIESVSYLWSTGETTQSIRVFYPHPDMGGGDQTYWLQVTGENGCSSTDTIRVWFDDLVQIIDLQHDIDLNAYPNPVSDVVNIELEIMEHGQYVFEVFDYMGRPVVRELKYFEPGTQKIQFNMNGHSPGVYILSVKSNIGRMGMKKIIKYSDLS